MTDAWPHEDVRALNAFYGNPQHPTHPDQPSPAWESASLVDWIPPYQFHYSDAARTPLKRLRVHKRCLSTFQAAFADVLKHFGQAAISAKRLDVSGGAYCYRLERGGSRLSVHSWGAAIDMDPGHNPFPRHWAPGMIDKDFAQILQAHGFCWRGAGGDVDPMHFQLCHH